MYNMKNKKVNKSYNIYLIYVSQNIILQIRNNKMQQILNKGTAIFFMKKKKKQLFIILHRRLIKPFLFEYISKIYTQL